MMVSGYQVEDTRDTRNSELPKKVADCKNKMQRSLREYAFAGGN
jgi:hypothetical protein